MKIKIMREWSGGGISHVLCSAYINRLISGLVVFLSRLRVRESAVAARPMIGDFDMQRTAHRGESRHRTTDGGHVALGDHQDHHRVTEAQVLNHAEVVRHARSLA